MASKTVIKARLAVKQQMLEKLYKAYLALLDGGVQSYTIDDRELTRFDLSTLMNEIEALEEEVDELEGLLAGARSRRAFGILPRDW